MTVSHQPHMSVARLPHALDNAVISGGPPIHSELRMRPPCGRRSQHDAAALHALQVARVHARLARQRHAARARHLQDACARSTPPCNELIRL